MLCLLEDDVKLTLRVGATACELQLTHGELDVFSRGQFVHVERHFGLVIVLDQTNLNL